MLHFVLKKKKKQKNTTFQSGKGRLTTTLAGGRRNLKTIGNMDGNTD
jgi:hypothetical protein